MNKVQKIREEVEIVVNRRLNLLNGDCFDLDEETEGFTNEIMDIIDSIQEEPTTSVWHDANETPTDKSKVIVWLGEELNEIVQCHYMYGKFVEKIPTEEYGKYVLVGNAIEGYSRQFVSNKKRADLTELVVKWAYIDELIKL